MSTKFEDVISRSDVYDFYKRYETLNPSPLKATRDFLQESLFLMDPELILEGPYLDEELGTLYLKIEKDKFDDYIEEKEGKDARKHVRELKGEKIADEVTKDFLGQSYLKTLVYSFLENTLDYENYGRRFVERENYYSLLIVDNSVSSKSDENLEKLCKGLSSFYKKAIK